MNINNAISVIKNHITECKQTGDTFALPIITNAKVEKIDAPNVGADLLHIEYDITLADGNSIHIDYHSKDKCRTFKINPDRSIIYVTCSCSDFNFSDAWDEND